MTYEEAIEYITERYVTMSMCLTLDECRKHNKAISMAIEALEKQIPKKAPNHDGMVCPSCNSKARYGHPYEYYCPHCGQAIDWEVDE